MKPVFLIRLHWLALLVEGVVVNGALLLGWGGRPSSLAMRLGLPALGLLLWLGIAAGGGWLFASPERSRIFWERLKGWLLMPGRRIALRVGCLALMILSLELFVFTFMFLPASLRGLALWLGLAALQTWIGLGLLDNPDEGLWPRLASLDARQRKLLAVLGLIGLVYFAAFIPANLGGAEDAGRLLVSGGDEVVIYPILTTMLTPGQSLRGSLYRLIEYDDYHYGYPFYALSALSVLPVLVIYGPSFESHTQPNLFLLRQTISVLPMVLAALVLTVLGTRLRSAPRSVGLFVLILSIPGVVLNNQRFWHPDGLTVLFVALTLFFIVRDRLRLGRNFYLAAFFCGLAASTRLVGFFFALAVAGYLAAAWLGKRDLWGVLRAGAWFITVMALTIVLSSPFLFDAGARGRMLATMGQKSGEMAHGYAEPDPQGVYQTGWLAWLPFFERNYAQGWFIVFLGLSVIAAWWGKERTFGALLLAWTALLGVYLVNFVAVKAFQYMLPLFVPLYSASLLLLTPFENGRGRLLAKWPWLGKGVPLLVLAACLAQFGVNLSHLLR